LGNHGAEVCDTGQVMNLKVSENAFSSITVVVPRRFSLRIWGANIPFSQKLWYAYIFE
jgi:hypothetical protein